MGDPWAVASVAPSDPWAVSAVQPAGPRGQVGYQRARQQIAQDQAFANSHRQNGLLDDFTRAVVGSTGALDEVGGGMSYLAQGAKNLVRQATGQPIRTTAGQAGLAAMDAEREWQARYAKDHPIANTAAAVTGMFTGRPTAAGLLAPRVGAGLTENALRAGAGVAAANAPFALARPEGTLQERLPNALKEEAVVAATGAGLSAAGRGLSNAAAKARTTSPKPKAPTLDEITTAKNAAYKAVDDSGVRYTPQAFSDMMESAAHTLDAEGYHAGLHPKTAQMMERIGSSQRELGGYGPTLTELDQLRQQIGRDVASSADPGERRMGQILRAQIDHFIDTAGPEQITGAADPEQAAQLIRKARDLNTRVEKLGSLDQLDDTAGRRAARTGSGGNKENALRQNVDRFLTDTGNLTPDEEAAARKVVMGTPTGNALREVGKLSPFGNGLGLAIHAVGGFTSHGTTLPLAAVGFGAKKVSEAMTRGNVAALRDLIAIGGRSPRRRARRGRPSWRRRTGSQTLAAGRGATTSPATGTARAEAARAGRPPRTRRR
jgi:hypothetical protein